MLVDVLDAPPEINTQRLEQLAAHIADKLWLDPLCETAISFVNAHTMEQLHLEWMQLPGPTDVMSFPMDKLTPGTPQQPAGPGLLGDVVVCVEVASKQAQAAEHSLQQEVELLVTHSLLHLLGFDHDNPASKAHMFGLQKELLAGFYAQLESGSL